MPTGIYRAQASLIRDAWKRSRLFRVFLILAGLYFLLRLGLQISLLFDPASEEVAADLQTYLTAARGLLQHAPLYPQGPIGNINFYQYAPSFALLFAPFTLLSPLAVQIVHTVLHLAAYFLLYFTWAGIFAGLGLAKVNEKLAETLPAWLVFSAFWGDLSYLNIYVIVALLASLLIRAVLEERLGWALLWLSILLQVKPQWAFAAALPLLAGNRRFFFKLTGLAALAYAGILALTLLASGPAYTWGQYRGYLTLLANMSAWFPWRSPASGFIGYNHSIKQILAFLFGAAPGVLRAADIVKLLLLLPLAAVCLRFLLAPKDARSAEGKVASDPWRQRAIPYRGAFGAVRWDSLPSQTRIELVFALYLGAFLWLDIFWELSLSIVIYAYLLATLSGRGSRAWVRILFLSYALLDVWQALSYAALGPDVLLQGAYVSTDPSIYLPIMMLILLAFLAVLTGRLWKALPGTESQPHPLTAKGEVQ